MIRFHLQTLGELRLIDTYAKKNVNTTSQKLLCLVLLALGVFRNGKLLPKGRPDSKDSHTRRDIANLIYPNNPKSLDNFRNTILNALNNLVENDNLILKETSTKIRLNTKLVSVDLLNIEALPKGTPLSDEQKSALQEGFLSNIEDDLNNFQNELLKDWIKVQRDDCIRLLGNKSYLDDPEIRNIAFPPLMVPSLNPLDLACMNSFSLDRVMHILMELPDNFVREKIIFPNTLDETPNAPIYAIEYGKHKDKFIRQLESRPALKYNLLLKVASYFVKSERFSELYPIFHLLYNQTPPFNDSQLLEWFNKSYILKAQTLIDTGDPRQASCVIEVLFENCRFLGEQPSEKMIFTWLLALERLGNIQKSQEALIYLDSLGTIETSLRIQAIKIKLTCFHTPFSEINHLLDALSEAFNMSDIKDDDVLWAKAYYHNIKGNIGYRLAYSKKNQAESLEEDFTKALHHFKKAEHIWKYDLLMNNLAMGEIVNQAITYDYWGKDSSARKRFSEAEEYANNMQVNTLEKLRLYQAWLSMFVERKQIDLESEQIRGKLIALENKSDNLLKAYFVYANLILGLYCQHAHSISDAKKHFYKSVNYANEIKHNLLSLRANFEIAYMEENIIECEAILLKFKESNYIDHFTELREMVNDLIRKNNINQKYQTRKKILQ